jgi:hypothetical protein
MKKLLLLLALSLISFPAQAGLKAVVGGGSGAGTLAVANGGTGTSTTFTQGSVVFAGASGVYSQDNANFFWDGTNHRIGIGNASPSTTLHVTGLATITYTGADATSPLLVDAGGSSISSQPAFQVIIPATGAQKAFQLKNNGAGGGWLSMEYNIGGSALPGFSLGVGGARDTNLYRNAASTLRTNSTLIVDGAVGIGTATPRNSSALDVNGILNVSGAVIYGSAAATLSNLVGNPATGKYIINCSSSAACASASMTTISGDISITSGGVGTNIGLNGVLLSGLATGLLQNTTGTGVPSIAAAGTLATSLTTPLVIGGTTASTALTLESTSGTGTTDSIVFKTGSQAQAMFINTSGNVGIGTTTAGSMLTIGTTGQATIGSTGNVSTSGTLAAATTTITSASATSLAVGPNGTTTPIFSVDSSVASAIDGVIIQGSAANGDINFNANGSTNAAIAFTMLGSGTMKLKNGSSSTAIPSAAPELAIRNTNNTASNSEAISFINSNSSGAGAQIMVLNGTQTASNSGTIVFVTYNAGTAAEAMRIDNSQNVAIGTTTTAGKLNVAGTIKTLGYTVSTLPAGTVGMFSYVTDQLTTCAVAGAALTGGGAVTCPVFYNGAAWVGN